MSDTKITATTPAESPGTITVHVTTPGGTTGNSSAAQYKFVAAPVVTAMSPTSGPVSGGTKVTITGTGFTGATTVMFGSLSATFKIKNDQTIVATAPARANPTNVQMTVTTTGGTSATSTASKYTYAAAPTITSLTPTSGPRAGGTTVTIKGTGFTGATVVTFGKLDATSYTVVSDTKITAVAPAHAAGVITVRVTAPGGVSAAGPAANYTYT